jgi:hypothetical protein
MRMKSMLSLARTIAQILTALVALTKALNR